MFNVAIQNVPTIEDCDAIHEQIFRLAFDALNKLSDIVDHDALYKTFKGDRADLALKIFLKKNQWYVDIDTKKFIYIYHHIFFTDLTPVFVISKSQLNHVFEMEVFSKLKNDFFDYQLQQQHTCCRVLPRYNTYKNNEQQIILRHRELPVNYFSSSQ